MTRRGLRPCAGSPLCPELVEDRYCKAHALDREQARGSAASRGYDREWWKTRARYLRQLRAADPEGLARCEECQLDEKTAQVQDPRGRGLHVDHIDGLGPSGPRGHDPDNLQALCQPCHGRKTAHQTGTKGGPHE
jgi:5-methylcytosine-specific restriction protein A